MAAPATHGVLFDVGYTLLDEEPRLAPALAWFAKRLEARGIPTSAAPLRVLYEEACLAPRQGIGGLLVQTAMAAGLDEASAREERRRVPWDTVRMPAYPGALDALRMLRASGLRLGVLANQPASAAEDLGEAGLSPLLDGVWLSEAVGREKPDPAFFRMALDAWGLPPARVAYVGDRPDNDVVPARRLGMHAVRVRLGPHARQAARGRAERPDHDAPDLGDAVRHLLAWVQGPAAPRAVRGEG